MVSVSKRRELRKRRAVGRSARRGRGRMLLWPSSGVSIDVEGLLEAVTGIQTLKAAQRKGGSARSPIKAEAARHGAKGGRPRKIAA